MKVAGESHRTIREVAGAEGSVEIVDQTLLPRRFELRTLGTLAEMAEAIATMRVRGAPLIGVSAAYGFALGLRENPDAVDEHHAALLATRPTAVNLRWALDRVRAKVEPLPAGRRAAAAWDEAGSMAEEDVRCCRSIGEHGARLLKPLTRSRGGAPLRIMTHCNAGWLATVDWGTALAPVYHLHDKGVPVHVWVSETRPRNQGLLTAWELHQHGVPFTLIADNAAGHLLQRGDVEVVITGTDRTTRTGDVANKIGTYLKALAAHEARVPFYVAAPSASIDWSLSDGHEIPIEERAASELAADAAYQVANPAFDVTPARLVTGLITERGVCPASGVGLRGLFPELAR